MFSGWIASATPTSTRPRVGLSREGRRAPTAAVATCPYDFVVLEGVSHWVPEQAAPTFTPLLLTHLVAVP